MHLSIILFLNIEWTSKQTLSSRTEVKPSSFNKKSPRPTAKWSSKSIPEAKHSVGAVSQSATKLPIWKTKKY